VFFGSRHPRDPRWVFHELTDILALAVLAVIAGAEGWEDIEEFGKQKREWLKKFLRLSNGVPSHDTISRVFRQIKPQAFQAGFTQWIKSLHEDLGLKLVAIDGKTLRRSHDKQTMKSALHSVCAWSVENHVTQLTRTACALFALTAPTDTQDGHLRKKLRARMSPVIGRQAARKAAADRIPILFRHPCSRTVI